MFYVIYSLPYFIFKGPAKSLRGELENRLPELWQQHYEESVGD